MTTPTPERPLTHYEQTLLRRSTMASVSVASALVLVKLGAWLLTDSLSMLSSLVDSIMDGIASTITFIAVRHAIKPADDDHRFGHGKWEALAGLSQAAFILGSAVFLIIEAVERFVRPSAIDHSMIGIGVMVFSILMTACLVFYQSHVVKKTQSLAVNSDKLHYAGDLLMNLAVIVALVLGGSMGLRWADPIIGVAIALFIGHGAWEIAKGALDMLLDRELPDEDRERIMDIIRANPSIQGFHDLRTRRSGPRVFVQVHLELHPEMILAKSHHIADQVMDDIMAAYPRAEVLVHQDPVGIEDPHGPLGKSLA